MKYKEFKSWCNERACDGCWSIPTALTCIKIMSEINKHLFWKREKEWQKICNVVENDIISVIDKKLKDISHHIADTDKTIKNNDEDHMIIQYPWMSIDDIRLKEVFKDFMDKYPHEIDMELIVIIQGSQLPTVLFYDGENFYEELQNGDISFQKVTHWMPLPDPPTTQQKNKAELTVDVEVLKHGTWLSNAQTDEYICSVCDGIAPVDSEKEDFYESNYCPNCGAKMNGKKLKERFNMACTNNTQQRVVFDFDGVIHSYKSGWQGAAVIPDEPVEGIKEAIEEIRAEYLVSVVSARCADEEGMKAVCDYLKHHDITVDEVLDKKPPAVVYIDDRAICFDGNSKALLDKIKAFKPWHINK